MPIINVPDHMKVSLKKAEKTTETRLKTTNSEKHLSKKIL